MPNSRFGYSVKKNSFKGLNIDCVQYSNIIRITYYSYSYSGTILNPNIIRIRIRPNICARILFVFVFAHSEKTNIIRIRIRSKFWFRIIFVFVFGPKNSIRSPLVLFFTICVHLPLSEMNYWSISVYCMWGRGFVYWHHSARLNLTKYLFVVFVSISLSARPELWAALIL